VRRRLPVVLCAAVGGVAAAAYAVGLGIYAVASTRGPVSTQPRTAGEARAAIRALGLAEAYPFEPRFLETPHGRMHYVESGRGAPVLCLHGSSTWSLVYRELLHGIGDHARVIAPDLVGFGLSEKPADPDLYTLDGHVEDVSALIRELGLRDLTLVLEDWGGPVGLGAAARAPGLVRRLVLINTWATPGAREEDPLPIMLRHARMPLAGETLVQGLGLLPRGVTAGSGENGRALRRAYRAVQGSWSERAGALAFPRLAPRAPDHPSGRLLEEIDRYLRTFDGDVLLIWGLRDRWPGAPALERWRARFPAARVLALAQAGAHPQEDAPAELVARIREFLAEPGPMNGAPVRSVPAAALERAQP
jgi:haloalkane dehalogenase